MKAKELIILNDILDDREFGVFVKWSRCKDDIEKEVQKLTPPEVFGMLTRFTMDAQSGIETRIKKIIEESLEGKEEVGEIESEKKALALFSVELMKMGLEAQEMMREHKAYKAVEENIKDVYTKNGLDYDEIRAVFDKIMNHLKDESNAMKLVEKIIEN